MTSTLGCSRSHFSTVAASRSDNKSASPPSAKPMARWAAVAAEAAHQQTQSEDANVAGQVGDGAPVVTLDADDRRPTTGTRGRGGGRDEQGNDRGRCQDEVVEAHAGTFRDGVEEEGPGRLPSEHRLT